MLRSPERQVDAAARLGVDPRTIRRWRASGRVGWSRIDGAVWVDRADLDDLLAAGAHARTVVPMPPVSDEPTPLYPASSWHDDEGVAALYAQVSRTRMAGATVR